MLSLDPADTCRFYLTFHDADQTEVPPPRWTRVDLSAAYLPEALEECQEVFLFRELVPHRSRANLMFVPHRGAYPRSICFWYGGGENPVSRRIAGNIWWARKNRYLGLTWVVPDTYMVPDTYTEGLL